MHLYWTNTIPDAWIVEDENGALWVVPCTGDGWTRRTPYRGWARDLNPCYATMIDLVASSCGLPAGKEEVHA